MEDIGGGGKVVVVIWGGGEKTYRQERERGGEKIQQLISRQLLGKIYCGDVQVFFHPRWRLYTSATLSISGTRSKPWCYF